MERASAPVRAPAASAMRLHRYLRKLVRSKSDKKFLALGGAWTANAVEATPFRNRPQARAAVMDLALNMPDLEFYFFFRNRKSRRRDFTMPLA